MKILQIINSMGTGGAEKLLAESIPEMNSHGIEVDLLLLNGGKHPFLELLEQTKCCKIYSLGQGSVYNPLLIFKIIPFLKKYDLIHVHLFPALYWVAMAKILSFSKIKLIFTEHNTSNRRRSFFYKILDKLMYSQYYKFIAITEEVKNNLYEHIHFEKSRYVVIENGIDISKIKNAQPIDDAFFKQYSDKTKLLMVSRFFYSKDQETIIRAMALLPKNVVLFLAGEGENKNNCEKISEQLGLKDRVIFLGVRSDIPRVLKTVDIVILSSIFEGLSLSSIEGMASGKPFIASDVPGLTDVVKDAGILFPVKDEMALAEIVKDLMGDENYKAKIVNQCQKRAEQYSLKKMVDSEIKLYKEIW